MTEQIVKGTEHLTSEEYEMKVSPLGRPGNAEDVAGCILWLASRAGAWISGNVLVTDGGKLGVVPSTY
jgi:NAD(P)-dependent dehydrogenase (short-subunit alcohol dehydrogenase family)